MVNIPPLSFEQATENIEMQKENAIRQIEDGDFRKALETLLEIENLKVSDMLLNITNRERMIPSD